MTTTELWAEMAVQLHAEDPGLAGGKRDESVTGDRPSTPTFPSGAVWMRWINAGHIQMPPITRLSHDWDGSFTAPCNCGRVVTWHAEAVNDRRCVTYPVCDCDDA